MVYALLADVTVFVHLAWIVFLIFGALIGARHPVVKAFHMLGLAFAVAMQVFGWLCPLTHVEVWLRARQGPGHGYAGSFIAHYAERLVYMDVSRGLIFGLTIVIIGFSTAVYLRGRRWRGNAGRSG